MLLKRTSPSESAVLPSRYPGDCLVKNRVVEGDHSHQGGKSGQILRIWPGARVVSTDGDWSDAGLEDLDEVILEVLSGQVRVHDILRLIRVVVLSVQSRRVTWLRPLVSASGRNGKTSECDGTSASGGSKTYRMSSAGRCLKIGLPRTRNPSTGA